MRLPPIACCLHSLHLLYLTFVSTHITRETICRCETTKYGRRAVGCLFADTFWCHLNNCFQNKNKAPFSVVCNGHLSVVVQFAAIGQTPNHVSGDSLSCAFQMRTALRVSTAVPSLDSGSAVSRSCPRFKNNRARYVTATVALQLFQRYCYKYAATYGFTTLFCQCSGLFAETRKTQKPD